MKMRIKFAMFNIKSYYCAAVLLGFLQLVSCWSFPSHDARPEEKFENPSWPKTDEHKGRHSPLGIIISLLQEDIGLNKRNYDDSMNQRRRFTLKEKRGWNRLPTWGKRANWSNIGGVWGKKDPAWTNLKGIWGKRNGN